MARKNFSLYFSEDDNGVVRVRFQAVPGDGEVVPDIHPNAINKVELLAARMKTGDMFCDKNGTDYLRTQTGLARTHVQTEHVFEVRGGRNYGRGSGGYYPALTDRGVVGLCLKFCPTQRRPGVPLR